MGFRTAVPPDEESAPSSPDIKGKSFYAIEAKRKLVMDGEPSDPIALLSEVQRAPRALMAVALICIGYVSVSFFSPGLPNPYDCDKMPDTQASFCRLMRPEVLASEVVAYQKLRSACKWFKRDAVTARHFMYEYYDSSRTKGMGKMNVTWTTSPEADGSKSWTRVDGATDAKGAGYSRSSRGDVMQIQSCEITTEDGLSTWSIDRVGPMRGNGGFDWNLYGYADAMGFTEDATRNAPQRERRFATGVYAAPLLDDGTPIGYPPVHMHHYDLHIGINRLEHYTMHQFATLFDLDSPNADITSKRALRFNKVMVQEHAGDDQCMSPDGGLDCEMKLLPNDVGATVNDAVWVNANFNDARLLGAPELVFYGESAVRWSTLARQKMRPLVQYFYQGPLQNEEDPGHNQLTFESPGNSISIVWQTQTLEHSGTMGKIHFHSHKSLDGSAWVFSALPAELGLGFGRFKLEPTAPWRPIRVNAASLPDVKLMLLKHLDEMRGYPAGTSSARCTYDGPAFEIVKGSPSDFFEQRPHDRNAHMQCSAWRFEAGQPMTMVAASDTRGMHLASGVGPQHSLYVVQYVPDSDKKLPYGHFGPNIYSTGDVRWPLVDRDLMDMLLWFRTGGLPVATRSSAGRST